jgi:hypothetical protein
VSDLASKTDFGTLLNERQQDRRVAVHATRTGGGLPKDIGQRVPRVCDSVSTDLCPTAARHSFHPITIARVVAPHNQKLFATYQCANKAQALMVCGGLAWLLRWTTPQNAPAYHLEAPGYVLNHYIPGSMPPANVLCRQIYALFDSRSVTAKCERWVLQQARITFEQPLPSLRVVTSGGLQLKCYAIHFPRDQNIPPQGTASILRYRQ